jgi:hypothetical protein
MPQPDVVYRPLPRKPRFQNTVSECRILVAAFPSWHAENCCQTRLRGTRQRPNLRCEIRSMRAVLESSCWWLGKRATKEAEWIDCACYIWITYIREMDGPTCDALLSSSHIHCRTKSNIIDLLQSNKSAFRRLSSVSTFSVKPSQVLVRPRSSS